MIDHDVRHSCSAEIVTLRPPVLLQPGNNAAGIQRDVTLQWRDCNYAPQEAGCQVRIKPAGGAYTYYMVDKDMAEKYISGLQVDASYLWNVRALGNGQNTLDSPWANSGEDWSFHTLDMFGLR